MTDTLRISFPTRLRHALGLLLGLRRHDFRAALTFMRANYEGQPFFFRWARFLAWGLRQTFCTIPDALQHVGFDAKVSSTPMWLAAGNPLANYPWSTDAAARLPAQVDTVAIGAGFTGAALAYHWSKKAPPDRILVLLEMNDPASGSSGRNQGLVVMGRYFHMVKGTVLKHLNDIRRALSEPDRDRLAEKFAAAYCKAAYRNADLIESTIRAEKFDCDYAREGWVQACGPDQQDKLEESVRQALETGFTDWTSITPADVEAKTGMQVRHNAAFSIAAASFHPAKWVWSLLRCAIGSPNVRLFTRTKVLSVEDRGETYLIETTRGPIQARNVVNAMESYTPLVHRQFHDLIQPTQAQAASGTGGPEAMKPGVGISASWFFCGRHGSEVMAGTDATRVHDHEAGGARPSRFLTKFLCGEIKRYFGPFRLKINHEWSGTMGYTPDEYPVVGLMDGKRQHVIGGMCGSGTGVSYNAARCIVNRILGITSEPDDYPPEYFSPTRLLAPERHPWPKV